MTAFLGLSGPALIAFGVLAALVTVAIVAMCRAAKAGQRPWSEIVQEAEERRKATEQRRRDDRP